MSVRTRSIRSATSWHHRDTLYTVGFDFSDPLITIPSRHNDVQSSLHRVVMIVNNDNHVLLIEMFIDQTSFHFFVGVASLLC